MIEPLLRAPPGVSFFDTNCGAAALYIALSRSAGG
jgi:hypothetical protein